MVTKGEGHNHLQSQYKLVIGTVVQHEEYSQ